MGYSNPVQITTMHYSNHLPKASVQGHHHPCPCDGLHLDHWAVCSGRGGEGLCLPLCLCQCLSGEEALVKHGYTKLCNIYTSNAFQMPAITSIIIHVDVDMFDFEIGIVYVRTSHADFNYSFPGPLFHDQGLFIFLFHVVRHEKVYGKIKSKLPNLKV